MSEEKEYYIDYRFIVKANSNEIANKLLDQFLPDANDYIWYTVTKSELKKVALKGANYV